MFRWETHLSLPFYYGLKVKIQIGEQLYDTGRGNDSDTEILTPNISILIKETQFM